MKVKDGYRVVNVQLDEKDIKKLDEIAITEGVLSRSSVVRMAIVQYLERKEASA